jgi:CYTH domain-containing protein
LDVSVILHLIDLGGSTSEDLYQYLCVRGQKFRSTEVAATPRAPVEIERKFLVASDGGRQSAVRSVGIRDGLIAAFKDGKVRVRISADIATVAIKGPRMGIGRAEFEYKIPIADAERMLSTICPDDTLEKQRFFVGNAEATWHVDVYGGILQGVVVAEVELPHATQN